MKPIVKVGTWWFFGKDVVGMTIFPFIFLDRAYVNRISERRYAETINHESIHIRQQIEMLVLFFYLWYLVEWLIRLIKQGGDAYSSLSFEQESYLNDTDLEYLKTRKFWGFLKYL